MRGVVAVTDGQRGEPDGLDRRSQTALETDLDLHRARPELDVAQAVGEDRIGQQRRGGRAVADGLSGLDRRVREKARAEVLDGVLELDLLHDRHPVVADERQAVLLLDQHRPRLRTEGAPAQHRPTPVPRRSLVRALSRTSSSVWVMCHPHDMQASANRAGNP